MNWTYERGNQVFKSLAGPSKPSFSHTTASLAAIVFHFFSYLYFSFLRFYFAYIAMTKWNATIPREELPGHEVAAKTTFIPFSCFPLVSSSRSWLFSYHFSLANMVFLFKRPVLEVCFIRTLHVYIHHFVPFCYMASSPIRFLPHLDSLSLPGL